jgi:glucokinase
LKTRQVLPVVGCCDVGGSTLRVALAARDGTLRAKKSFAHTRPAPDAVVDLIARNLKAMTHAADAELVAVGAAVPGPLDPPRGIVYFSPNLEWREFPFTEKLAAQLGVRVVMDDDANCAAWGEHAFGVGNNTRDFLYVIVGTGIGAGLILDGKLYRGARGLAGELGHTTIVPDGPLCACGNRGCVEALAAGLALARRMRELDAQVGDAITAREVIALAREGNPHAYQVLHEAGTFLGMALANAVNLLNPERIALGGGVALDADELLREPARAEMQKRAFAHSAESVSLVRARLGDDAGLVGAARLAWESLEEQK